MICFGWNGLNCRGRGLFNWGNAELGLIELYQALSNCCSQSLGHIAAQILQ